MLPQKQLLRRSLVVALFALSCFGLLVFLWSAFGGPVPLRAQGYEFSVDFDEANQLGIEAEVRRSGVPVGRVVGLKRSPDGLTRATIQLDPEYVPARVDTRATLRAKSLVGETYVEISPGRPNAPALPDRGQLPKGNVEQTVQLDEIFRSLDAPTRAAFQEWFQQQALATAGRGRDINDSLAQFAPLSEQATALLSTLNQNGTALSRLVDNTGNLFTALSDRGDQLQGLVRNANTVFATTAARDRQLAEAFVAFPAFQREARTTLGRLNTFQAEADPVITELRGVAAELTPAAQAAAELAPELRDLTVGLGPAQQKGEKGLPAADQVVEGLGSFTRELPPVLAQLNPFVGYVGAFQNDLLAFAVNVTAASQAVSRGAVGDPNRSYLRILPMMGPDQLALHQQRPPSDRNEPYPVPNQTFSLSKSLPTYETRQCDGRQWPTILDGPGVSPESTQLLRERYGTVPIAPPCTPSPLRDGKKFPQLGPGAVPKIP